ETADGSRLVCVDRVLHFHGFQHDQQFALFDLLTVLDGDLDDGALHRCGDRVPADRGLAATGVAFAGFGLRRRSVAATTAECEVAGQRHFESPAADLHDDLLPFGGVVRGGCWVRERFDPVVPFRLDPAGVDGETV